MDPKILDPNEIVGTPIVVRRWVSPDWTKVQRTPGEGLREQRVKITTYRDGRQLQEMLGTDDEPISQIGGVSYDADLRKSWQEADRNEAKTEVIADPANPSRHIKRTTYQTGRVEDKPATAAEVAQVTGQQPQPARTPEQTEEERIKLRREQQLESERQWNQANGGLYETHAERREREAKIAAAAATQADRAADNTRADTQVGISQQNANTSAGQLDVARQNANKPAVHTVPEGTRVISVGPDGKVSEVPGPGASPGLATVDIKTAQSNIFNRIQKLRDLAATLRQRMTSDNPAERITAAEAKGIYEQVKSQEEAAQQADLAIINTQAAIHSSNVTWAQTQQQTANQRLQESGAAVRNANDTMRMLVPLGGRGSGEAAAAAYNAMIQRAYDTANLYGGLTNARTPEFGPALRAVGAMALPGYEAAAPVAVAPAPAQPAAGAGPAIVGVDGAGNPVPAGAPATQGWQGNPSPMLTQPPVGDLEARLNRAAWDPRQGLQGIIDDPWYDNAIVPTLAAELGVSG